VVKGDRRGVEIRAEGNIVATTIAAWRRCEDIAEPTAALAPARSCKAAIG